MADWENAAQRYRAAEAELESDRKKAAKEARDAERLSAQRRKDALAEASTEFRKFLESTEGKQALSLLRASRTALGIVVFHDTAGNTMECYLAEYGLFIRRAHIAERGNRVEPERAVGEFCDSNPFAKREPKEFMPWLRGQLDEIAAAAPSPKRR